MAVGWLQTPEDPAFFVFWHVGDEAGMVREALGAKRWMPPTLPQPWHTTLDASRYKPACAQAGSGGQQPHGAGPSTEDCLYLDIYTPADLSAAGAPKLAVVLFVHGGGFMGGDSSGGGGPGGTFNGTYMAAAQQVVVVSVNYRMCVQCCRRAPCFRKPVADCLKLPGESSASSAARSCPHARRGTALATSESKIREWPWSGPRTTSISLGETPLA